MLFVEAASMAGNGGLVLTGQLGDVMKESARIALSYVESHASQLGIDEHAFEGRQFHMHVPAVRSRRMGRARGSPWSRLSLLCSPAGRLRAPSE